VIATVEELIDRENIRDLVYSYCRAIDRADMALLRSLVWPEARFEYGIFSGSAFDFADFAEQFLAASGPTHHNVTNSLIELHGERARAESYCIAYHGDIKSDEGLIDLIVQVRYIDRFEKRSGRWKFAHRMVVYDWNQNLPKTALWEGPLHGLYDPRGARGSTDAWFTEAGADE